MIRSTSMFVFADKTRSEKPKISRKAVMPPERCALEVVIQRVQESLPAVSHRHFRQSRNPGASRLILDEPTTPPLLYRVPAEPDHGRPKWWTRPQTFGYRY